ncbi:MAG: chloride channel protein [Bacteroidetes bacterium HGW-Bacteroidetes-5]|jgi:CIC family chloride channel protein|nr:MAG: chloride channel protein [Bacteroidetes bacterium HGW-Bacteroidetes-5]
MMNRLLKYLSGQLLKLSESKMLVLLAFITGLLSGFAAVLLKNLIHFFAWILKGWFNTTTESSLYLIYPGVGMLIAYLLVRYLIKENIGHGVTKVLLAISKNDSKIKPHNTWSSIAASSVTIGFGGSVGAEAPIVYTGAAIGSNLARLMGLSYKHMTILLGCGAAGAVAGIFKAPLAGILFSLEILLFSISITSIIPLLVSAVTAATVSFIFMGKAVVFSNSIESFNIGNIPYYILLGIVCGFISLYFTRTTLSVEDRLKNIHNPYKRWIISSLSLGILIFIFPPLYGEGYESLTSLLNGDANGAIGPNVFGDLFTNQWFVLIFFVAVIFFKVLAMSFTNAGGGVGGTFGPTLFIGGVTGFVLSKFVNLSGFHTLPEANFALVGMAGLMAGVMQAPLTAIFLIAEITGGYVLLMPLIITSLISFITIRSFEPYSIYTKRIANQGELLTHDNDKTVLTLLKTSDLIETDFQPVSPSSNLANLVNVIANSKRNIFPVVDSSGVLQGIILLDDIREIMFTRELYEKTEVVKLMKDPPNIVSKNEKMDSVMRKFESCGAWNLPVVNDSGQYIGFVSKSKIFSAYRDQLQQVSHE